MLGFVVQTALIKLICKRAFNNSLVRGVILFEAFANFALQQNFSFFTGYYNC